MGVKAVFAVVVRAEQAVVSVTGQGLVTSSHTRLLFPGAGTSLTNRGARRKSVLVVVAECDASSQGAVVNSFFR